MTVNHAPARQTGALCAGLLLLCLAGCGREQEQRLAARDGSGFLALSGRAASFTPSVGRRGGVLRLCTSTDPATFNPFVSQEPLVAEIAGLVFEGLTRIDGASGEPAPALAQSWEALEGGRVWVFRMRRGLAWSDSTPVTAHDVVFTFDSLIADSVAAGPWLRQRFTFGGELMRVSAADSFTVRCELASAFSLLPMLMTQPVLSERRYGASVAKGLFGRALGLRFAADSVVGSGPFVLSSYVATRRIVLRRNGCYWRRDAVGNSLPYLDSVVYVILPDENTKLVRFTQAEFDCYAARGQDWDALRRGRERGGYAMYCLGPARSATALVFNVNPGRDSAGAPLVDPSRLRWFSDSRVRQAIACALDRQAMVAGLCDSAGFAQPWAVPPCDTGLVPPRVKSCAYDTVRVRKLLAAAGIADRDRDGVVEDSMGAKVRFAICVASGNTLRQKVGERICQDLAAVGLAAALDIEDYGVLVDRLTRPLAWEAALVGLPLPSEPLLAADLWRSSGSLHLWNPGQAVASTPWELRIDSLLDAAAGQPGASARQSTYRALVQLLAEQQPLVFTIVPERIVCLSSRLANVNPSPAGGVLHNVEELYWQPDSTAPADSVP